MRLFIWFLLAFSWIEDSEETYKAYPFMNFTDVTPYTEIPCPKHCNDRLKTGIVMAGNILGSVFEASVIPVDFCQECRFGGIQNMTGDILCFMSPEGDVFDYHVTLYCPHFYVNCTCDLSNDPSIAAEQINQGKLVAGECGKEKYQNKHKCETVKCAGTGQGQSTVNLMTNVSNIIIHAYIRVDTRKDNPGTFPPFVSLTTNNDEPVIHEGPPEFDDAWNCLKENQAGVLCQIIGNYPVHIYRCLNGNSGELISSIIYEYGKCDLFPDES